MHPSAHSPPWCMWATLRIVLPVLPGWEGNEAQSSPCLPMIWRVTRRRVLSVIPVRRGITRRVLSWFFGRIGRNLCAEGCLFSLFYLPFLLRFWLFCTVLISFFTPATLLILPKNGEIPCRKVGKWHNGENSWESCRKDSYPLVYSGVGRFLFGYFRHFCQFWSVLTVLIRMGSPIFQA